VGAEVEDISLSARATKLVPTRLGQIRAAMQSLTAPCFNTPPRGVSRPLLSYMISSLWRLTSLFFLTIFFSLNKTHLLLKPLKFNLLQWLGHAISDHIVRRDVVHFAAAILYQVPDIVVANVDMLRSIVKVGVLCESNSTLVVPKHMYKVGILSNVLSISKVSKNLSYLLPLFYARCQGNIFRLAARGRNRSLLLA